MSKGRRIRFERVEGKRKPNGTYWNEIQCGMTLVTPAYWRVERGQAPHMIPTPYKRKYKGQAMGFHKNRFDGMRSV